MSTSPVVAYDGTVIFGASDQYVYAIDGVTGAEIWRFKTGGAVFSDPAIVYTAETMHDMQSGSWSFAGIASPGVVYVASDNCYLYMLDVATGRKIGALKLYSTTTCAFANSQITASPAIDYNTAKIYIGWPSGKVYALQLAGVSSSGVLLPSWPVPYDTGAAIYSTPAIGREGNVYVLNSNGMMTALDSGGTLLWVKSVGGSGSWNRW